MIQCSTCHRKINEEFPKVQYNHWLKLLFYFEHEYAEEEITQTTHEQMVDALMSVKPYLEEK